MGRTYSPKRDRLSAAPPSPRTSRRFPDAGRRLERYRNTAGTLPAELLLRARALVTPRHRPGVVRVHGLSVAHPDLQSVAAQFHDIFGRRLYHFETESPAPRVLDGGAYVGMAALYFKSVHPRARITSFEPDPDLAALFRRNMTANRIDDVELVNAALGAEHGRSGFAPDGADGGQVVEHAADRTVATVPLSEYLDEPVDLLKLDVEGSELTVLEEAGERLAHVRQLVIEHHGWPGEPQRLGPMLSLLDEHGFRYLVNHGDYYVNESVRPPFRLSRDTRWTALVYARRI